MAFDPVNTTKEALSMCMAIITEGGVAFEAVNITEGGVAFQPVGITEEGVAYTYVNITEEGVASFRSTSLRGRGLAPVSHSGQLS